MKIYELMTEGAVTVRPTTSLKDVAHVLAEMGISGVPVVDDERRAVGVISEADIVAREQGPAPSRAGVLGRSIGNGRAEDVRMRVRTAGEAMTTPAITISAGADVSYAARRMVEYGVKRLPVVNADGQLMGIVTRSDLVRAFARSDAELEREIRGEMVSTLWLDEPERLEIDVADGMVELSGTVHRRSDAELLRVFVGRVPGVVGVKSTVSWAWDDRQARV